MPQVGRVESCFSLPNSLWNSARHAFSEKMADAAGQQTVKDLVLELIERRIQELEKKGVLPKGK